MRITATNALIGLAAGSVHRDRARGARRRLPADRRDARPLVAAIAVVPIVALTPILNTMFGASSQFGRQAVAAIAAFVPVFVNVLRGLRQTRPVHRDLLRASAATSAADVPGASRCPPPLPYLHDGTSHRELARRDRGARRRVLRRPAEGIGTAIASYAKSGALGAAPWPTSPVGIAIGLAFFLVTSLLERLVSRRAPV